jgi:hypothetical protein
MKKKQKEQISEDDAVFILQNEDETELYVIDNPVLIAKLEAKIEELKGMDETEISKHLLSIVNPDRYPVK